MLSDVFRCKSSSRSRCLSVTGDILNICFTPQPHVSGWLKLLIMHHVFYASHILEKWQNFLRKDCASWYGVTAIFVMLPRWHRDRQLQQNSWEERDRTGNECQLDSSEGEAEVLATLACSLRGALYWMYCITSIPT